LSDLKPSVTVVIPVWDDYVGFLPEAAASVMDEAPGTRMPGRLTVPAGSTTFAITNQGSTKATEFEVLKGSRVLAEKENITEGIDAEVSLDLAPGRYATFCGGGTPKGVLVATGD
jgi:iron uptake system EfeUOB component EfeO/EfeM